MLREAGFVDWHGMSVSHGLRDELTDSLEDVPATTVVRGDRQGHADVASGNGITRVARRQCLSERGRGNPHLLLTVPSPAAAGICTTLCGSRATLPVRLQAQPGLVHFTFQGCLFILDNS